jgi:hypothetical protein
MSLQYKMLDRKAKQMKMPSTPKQIASVQTTLPLSPAVPYHSLSPSRVPTNHPSSANSMTIPNPHNAAVAMLMSDSYA